MWFINDYWLVVEPPTPLKNDGVKVSWDDEILNWMETEKMFQTTVALENVQWFSQEITSI